MSPVVSKVAKAKAAQLCQDGLAHYQSWNIEQAIDAFESAIQLNRTQADYHLYLAQAYMRVSDYNAMRKSLGEFIHRADNPKLVERFEALFGSAFDSVETWLTDIMPQHNVPLEVVGAAIQMWLEFRLAKGKEDINTGGLKPQVWAAALDYTVRKINFHEIPAEELANWYGVSAKAVKQHHHQLIDTLDIMPCDYRYFRGINNPLDKLVEAAEMLETLETRFFETS